MMKLERQRTMSNQVATKKNAELSTDVLDDIFETAGEGAAFDSSEMQIPLFGSCKLCHRS
jgi:hypothetical protein